ncbi:hypothetical protein AB0B83_20110 [Micromonospora sp. NPDC049060]|uniref:hypothetical protein n=1 Tax=unclassified Micromonospora TaxID=2617518 RepID=UPI0033EF8E39
MKSDQDFEEFVDAIQSANFDPRDTRATAHTAAVFASDWDRIEKAIDAEQNSN